MFQPPSIGFHNSHPMFRVHQEQNKQTEIPRHAPNRPDADADPLKTSAFFFPICVLACDSSSPPLPAPPPLISFLLTRRISCHPPPIELCRGGGGGGGGWCCAGRGLIDCRRRPIRLARVRPGGADQDRSGL